jgi:nucleotide-binding universal stress UspA family protein
MYKRVLVAVGDDPQVDTPVEYAITLAARTGAEVCFLRVLTVPLVCGAPDMVACSTLAMESVMHANEHVLACAVEAAVEARVSYTVTLRWGAIPDAIMQTAEETDCELIVVGSPVCPGWRQRRLNGYIARKVVAKARQPVLVIGQSPPDIPGASLWPRLLVVTDDSPCAEAAVEYALALAQEEALEVCLLHIDPARSPFASFGAASRAKNTLALAAAWAAASGVNYAVQQAAGDVVSAILEAATRQQCDAIILGVHGSPRWQRILYDRTTRLVTARSPLPVLLVNRLAVCVA